MPDSFEQDQTQAFLDTLPEIKPDENFAFACHPGVRCFNACCADLNLMLTPYDVLRLRRGLEMSSEDFLHRHCSVSSYPDTGFPMLHLRMSEDANKSCPYVSPAGCTVYPNRPSACRIYPIGRATRYDAARHCLVEQFFVVQEDHCQGFEEASTWNVGAWTADQGLAPYTASNDRFSLLMAAIKAAGRPLHPKHGTMCLLALYQLDRFQDFIRDMNLLDRLELPEERRGAVLEDEEQCLDFSLDWIELMLFGVNDRLMPSK